MRYSLNETNNKLNAKIPKVVWQTQMMNDVCTICVCHLKCTTNTSYESEKNSNNVKLF